MSKQTAVEWLIKEIEEKHNFRFGNFYWAEIYQALAMEREQIEDAFDAARFLRTKAWDGEDYFTETYGKEADNANG